MSIARSTRAVPPGPAGSAERLSGAFRLHGDPVHVLHGAGVLDVFVCRDHLIRGFEEAVWEELHAAGFERIAFVNAIDALYFLDEDSSQADRRATAAPGPGGSAGANGDQRRGGERMRFAGPHGNTRRRDGQTTGRPRPERAGPAAGVTAGAGFSSSSTTSSGEGGSTSTFSAGAQATAQTVARAAANRRTHGMAADYLIRLVRGWRERDTPRTAVVFIRAEHYLAHIPPQVARDLAELFGEVIGGRHSSNLVVLHLQHPDRGHIAEEVRRLNGFAGLADWLDLRTRNGRAFGLVGPPPPAELARAVQVMRLRHSLKIDDWSGLDRLTAAMGSEASAGSRQWLQILRDLAAAGTPLAGPVLAQEGHLTGGVPDGRTAWQRLDDLVGLDGVKQHIRLLTERMRMAASRPVGDGPGPDADARHLIFTGNPGTGKTTVARLVGEIYRDIGVLTRGHLVAPEVSDLVTQNVGGTPALTNRAVDDALDGVLFVDEAYRLTEGSEFGQEAVNTLLGRMENDRDRLVVIAAGYTAEMERFLRANPGLPSRFPAANVIEFPDYGVDDLLRILHGMLHSSRLTWEEPAEAALREVVTGLHRVRGPRFGNAREMRQLASDLEAAWSTRVLAEARQAAAAAADQDEDAAGLSAPAGKTLGFSKPTAPGAGAGRAVRRGGPAEDHTALWSRPLLPEDIPQRYRIHLASALPAIDEVLAELDGLTGLGPVRDQLVALHARLRHRQRIGAPNIVAPHLLFVGPPGTGKTTVARLVGKMFHAMGLLQKPAVRETGRADLVRGYVGQSEERTTAVIEEARGGVLFIDEAYALAPRGDGIDFGREVIDTLVPAMENLRGQLVVIAAGYPDAMDRFLATNEGLPSRFTQRIEFPDYPANDLVTILENTAAEALYRVDPVARPAIADWFTRTQAADPRSFANARTARGLLEEMEKRLIARTAHLPDDADLAVLTTLTEADLPG